MDNEKKVADKESVQMRLERLGLKTVARNLVELKLRKQKMMIAYEHYRFITPQKLEQFQMKLHKQSTSRYSYQQLSFTALSEYKKVPPEEVLVKLEEAIGRNCFDHFEVAHIIDVKIDPLLIGTINGCLDKFYIAGWDNDVKIEDILKAHEG